MEPKKGNDAQMIAAADGLIPGGVVAPVAPAVPGTPGAPVNPTNPANINGPGQSPTLGAPIVINTPLGTQTYGGKPMSEIVLTSFADVQAFAKDFMGVEIKEIKDFVPLFNQFKEAQTRAAEADQLRKIVDGYTTTLKNLPSDVSLLVQTAIQGEDHVPILQRLQQKASMNFDKPFESHDTLKLVNHYTGKQYTKEAFDALDATAKDALLDSTKLKYESEREQINSFITTANKATEERQNKFRASVESSIANMLTSNPQMDKAAVERVRQIMQYGVADALFTKDKVYAPNAAEKIAMMEFGKDVISAQAQTIGDIVKKLTNQQVSQHNEQLLLRSDRPALGGPVADQNVISKIVEQETSFIKVK